MKSLVRIPKCALNFKQSKTDRNRQKSPFELDFDKRKEKKKYLTNKKIKNQKKIFGHIFFSDDLVSI